MVSPTRNRLLRPVATIALALACGGALEARQDASLEAARDAYVAAVRDKLSAEQPEGLDVGQAKQAIDAVAAVPDPQALEILLLDAGKVADRLEEFAVEHESSKLDVERLTGKLKDASGSDRSGLEQQLKDAEKELEKAKRFLPLFRELNSAMTAGLLASIEKVGSAQPAEVWGALVAGLREDMRAIEKTDERQRNEEAELASLRNKLAAAKDDEKEKLHRRGAELAAHIESAKARIAGLEDLRDRRITTLAAAFPQLDKGRQTKELNDLKANLKDDAEIGIRQFSVELYGRLPAADAYSAPLTVLKKAATERDKIEKDLEPLREKYNRAARALITASIGGGGTVKVSLIDAERSARAELQEASNRSYGLRRVIEASARGMGHAMAAMNESDRKKASAEALKLARSYGDRLVRAAVLEAFTQFKDEQIAEELRGIAAKDPEVNTRLAALEALTAMQDEAAVDLCIEALLKDPDWRVRAAAIRLLVEVPRKQAIPALIAAVGAEAGRLVEDAESALTALTGMSFNGQAQLWKDWWAANEATFDLAKAKQEAVAKAESAEAKAGDDWRKQGAHVSFYGITTKSNRILFVLDRSGSMNEPATDTQTGKDGGRTRFEIAIEELKTAINGLQDGDVFNLVHYSNDVERWQKQMQKSSLEVRRKATTYVDKDIEAIGGTNIYDALREAFRLAGIGAIDRAYDPNVDTIFFLTDGEPTVGEVTEPAEILRRVREWNSLAKVVVHAVGVGHDHNSAFLRRLAEENGGTYVSR